VYRSLVDFRDKYEDFKDEVRKLLVSVVMASSHEKIQTAQITFYSFIRMRIKNSKTLECLKFYLVFCPAE
jgi:hypothetical protein